MTKEKRAAGNKVLPKAGLNSFDWTFVEGSIFVLRLNSGTKKPGHKPKTCPAAYIVSQKFQTHIRQITVIDVYNGYFNG